MQANINFSDIGIGVSTLGIVLGTVAATVKYVIIAELAKFRVSFDSDLNIKMGELKDKIEYIHINGCAKFESLHKT